MSDSKQLPDWDDLRGRAPDATGDLSSEAFVRELRDGWDRDSTSGQLTLRERVRRFNLGTPTALHVGTHELVNDLWRELESMSRQPADADPSPPVRQHSGDRSAHTPGPWEFNSISPLNGWLEGANGKTIFHCDPDSNETPNDADARLIAAAPDMLAALEKAFAVLGSEQLDGVFAFCFAHGYRYSGPSINIDELRSVIAAAVGDRPDAAQPPIHREPI